ncbi:methyltransferase [Paraburkholderia dinghuensis]|nr:methyltransferase [Paraburkholderia dinghuensis]
MRQQLRTGIAVVSAPQLFATAVPLAVRAVKCVAPRPGERALEPSAGTGRILRALACAQPDTRRVAVEINVRLCEALATVDPHAGIICADFLQWQPSEPFDCIVMNPPFGRGVDIAHIRHALAMLRRGGRMAAICAAGPRQYRELVPLVEAYGGGWEKLPDGTFSEAGTNVNTLLLTFGCKSQGVISGEQDE